MAHFISVSKSSHILTGGFRIPHSVPHEVYSIVRTEELRDILNLMEIHREFYHHNLLVVNAQAIYVKICMCLCVHACVRDGLKLETMYKHVCMGGQHEEGILF